MYTILYYTMSSSNAAAIRRRVGTPTVATSTPSTPGTPAKTQSTSHDASNQMTLQQVITTIDKRLTQLETIAANTNNNNSSNNESNDLPIVVDEFNSRFELIVTEINSLKDVVMKLQSYTMDVNKMLVDERIQILSSLDNHTVSSSTVNTNFDAESLTSADLKTMVQQELHN